MNVNMNFAPCDGMPFLPHELRLRADEATREMLAREQCSWLLAADDSVIRERARDLAELLIPAADFERCRERVAALGWRYHLSGGWIDDDYADTGTDPRYVRVHLSRSTTAAEDAAADYAESGKLARDRAWRRAGF